MLKNIGEKFVQDAKKQLGNFRHLRMLGKIINVEKNFISPQKFGHSRKIKTLKFFWHFESFMMPKTFEQKYLLFPTIFDVPLDEDSILMKTTLEGFVNMKGYCIVLSKYLIL
jgi:hypothetical protein